MQINIKTSGENQAIVTQLTKKLTGGTKENVIARIALGFCLQVNALPNRNFLRTIHKAKNTKTIFCLMDSIEISILP